MPDQFVKICTGSAGADLRQVAMFDACSAAWLASFTVGAHTVSLRGPYRSFREGPHCVRHGVWVRTYPRPFSEDEFEPGWLARALEANACGTPDILALAQQYIVGSKPIPSEENPRLEIAGNASYGPEIGDTREEGSDFNDYLGIAWSYPGEPVDQPELRQFRCLDCSGYVRMVFGYRRNPGNIALCRAPRENGTAIPRRARDIASHSPGELVLRNTTQYPVTDFCSLAHGDLVFFDADPADGPDIDHVGIYLGRDTKGHRRFISSRKHADGPTMSDIGGRSILNGDGLYARTFRMARRL